MIASAMKAKKTDSAAPALPRFQAPKSMVSKIYKTKKDKSQSRQALKRDVEERMASNGQD